MSVIYNFDGGGGSPETPSGWGWVRDDGVTGCGGLAPGTSSNVAEYTALTMAVHDALTLTTREDNFLFLGDSMLVVQQVHGNWRVNADKLRPLVHEIRMLLDGLPQWGLQWVPRKQNSKADEQAWKGKTLWTPQQPASSVAHAAALRRGWQ